MASSMAYFPLLPDEKSGNHQKCGREGKPRHRVLQMIVAELRFGACGSRKAVRIAAGKLLQDKGGDLHVRGNGHGRQHRRDIPPVPEISIGIIVGVKKPALMAMGAHHGVQFHGCRVFRPFGSILQVGGNNTAINQGHDAVVALEGRYDLPTWASLKRDKLVPFGPVIEYASRFDGDKFDIAGLGPALKGFTEPKRRGLGTFGNFSELRLLFSKAKELPGAKDDEHGNAQCRPTARLARCAVSCLRPAFTGLGFPLLTKESALYRPQENKRHDNENGNGQQNMHPEGRRIDNLNP